MKYQIKHENGYNSRPDKADTLVDARQIARHAVSSALGEPARVGIYRNQPPAHHLATPDLLEPPECLELWEDGKRIWKG